LKQIKQFTPILVTAMLLLCINASFAQGKYHGSALKGHRHLSDQLKEFFNLASHANVSFVFPKGFKEVEAPDDEDFSYDYAMEIPGKDFEIWFQVRSQKENWTSYEHTMHTPNAQLANPDSLYIGIGTAQARAFTGAENFFMRNIPPESLAPYHADAGRSYLLTLLDLPETKHYKYALLVTLQKFRTGTIIAVCFCNEKGPEFFKDIELSRDCIKFNPEIKSDKDK